MNYATGYGITPKDLYTTFKRENITTPLAQLWDRSKPKVCGAIFTFCMLQILNDVIDNNVVFKLPVNTEAYIEMKTISGEDFKKARQNGAFSDINITSSNFKGNQLVYRARRKEYWKVKSIKVSKVLKNRITEHTNKGKNYS